MEKDFKVKIFAYGYRTEFTIKAKDLPEAIEQSIVDKLGENSVKWDESGFYDKSRKYITYEEVINDRGPIQTKKVLGVDLGAGAP
jgi:apolipoprotein N-acyltransferase